MEELAISLGDEIGPVADAFFSTLIRMAGSTKRIIAHGTQKAATAILLSVHYRASFLHEVQQAAAEKNAQCRLAAMQHIHTMLLAYRSDAHAFAGHKTIGDVLSQVLARGLQDQNKDARQAAREAYWPFKELWPTEGHKLLENLDAAARKQCLASAPAGAAALPETSAPASRPIRRAAGPSQALLAAKRAASQRMQANTEPHEMSRTSLGRDEDAAPPQPPVRPQTAGSGQQTSHTASPDAAHEDSPATEGRAPTANQIETTRASAHPRIRSRADADPFVTRTDRLGGLAAQTASSLTLDTPALASIESWLLRLEESRSNLRIYRDLAQWAARRRLGHPAAEDPAALARLVTALLVPLQGVAEEESLAALSVVHTLIQNQFIAVQASGAEESIVLFCIDSGDEKSRSRQSAKAHIGSTWAHQADPAYGIDLLSSAYKTPSPSSGDGSSTSLRLERILSLLGSLLVRLPGDLVDDELTRVQRIIHDVSAGKASGRAAP